MRRLLLGSALALIAGLAASPLVLAGGSTAPGIVQSGAVTAGHCAQFSAPGVAIDSGASCGTGTAGVTQATGTTPVLVNGDGSAHTGAITVSLVAGAFLTPANNLSDLASASTARTNLGLGTFATQNFATPPAIGGTTPAAGAFTTLGATGAVTFTGLTTGTQLSCLGLDAGNHIVLSAAACGAGGGGITTLTGDVTASGSGSVAATLATVNSNVGSFTNANITVNAKGLVTAASNGTGGSGGISTVTDPSGNSQTSATTAQLGQGLCTTTGSSGTAPITPCAPDRTQTTGGAGATIAATDMAGLVNFNGSSLTGTIPAISSTVFPTGATAAINNFNSSALTISSTPTINGCASQTSIFQGGFMLLTSNGTSLDCLGFPGFGALSGGLSVTGAGVATLRLSSTNLTGINGNTGVVATVSGATVNGHLASWDGAGNLVDGGSGGSGCTVSGSAGLVFNNGSAACITDTDVTFSTHTITIGASGILDMSAMSVTGGLKIPSSAGAAPIADGFIGFDTTAHDLVFGSNGSTAKVAALNLPQTFTAAQRGQPATITISTSTFTPNFDTAQNQQITLVHASCPCTLANPSTTPVAGQSGMFVITQSATGSDTIGTWGSQYAYAGGTSTITLSTGASVVDYLPYYVLDATHIILGGIVKGPTH